ncbi:FIST N-terminal domain-containing protein [uncultured Roseibium sp.]|uniref:FIST N-terminal domain-containing protein n=1 Tax=uncultured Roseibium sp. TaxID=1936171 RepID=UPI0026101522|nr:FIST N-terminal domain-containing protein [uncultured Roseibium sp.]
MNPKTGTRYACGVVVLSAGLPDEENFWAEIDAAARTGRYAQALLFFSQDQFPADIIRNRMAHHADGLAYAACSTAGEIGGSTEGTGQCLAVLFPKDQFSINAVRIDGIRSIGFDRIVAQVKDARQVFDADVANRAAETEQGDAFAICLIDGLSVVEEMITAALHWALDDIPLLGGSAGDSMHFNKTSLILNGEISDDCAIVLFCRSAVPFRIFKTDNFVPTERKLVVTRSDPERRIIYEFNAAEAAGEYARAVGIDPGSLSPMSFASHPLVVRVGGEYYCRSVQKVNPDGSLSFFCAIDDGIVLTVAEPTGMTKSTNEAFEGVANEIGPVDFVLGFDCVLRRIDAQNRQATQRIQKIYEKYNVVGFNTYGEQYLSMHLNQTFTGIAFAQQASIAGEKA